MAIEPKGYPVFEPETALGLALVDFFDVIKPVYASANLSVVLEDYHCSEGSS